MKGQHTNSASKISVLDAMILAYAQMIQPTNAEEVYISAKDTIITNSLTNDDFSIRFNSLSRHRFMWRTANNKYIVTPQGQKMAEMCISKRKRDLFRILILNKQRYNK